MRILNVGNRIRVVYDRPWFEAALQKYRKNTEKIPPLTAEQQAEIAKYWGRFSHAELIEREIRYLTHTTGVFRPDYIPSSVFHHIILPVLNPPHFACTLCDKNYLDLYLKEVPTPFCVVRNIDGKFYDHDFRLISATEAIAAIRQYSSVVIKPTIRTHSGAGVRLAETATADLEAIFSKYQSDYVFQVPLKQSAFMKQLNESSVNCFRVSTCFIGKKPQVMSAFVKVGAAGEFADNSGKTRRFIGVEGNQFQAFAVDGNNCRFPVLPNEFNFAGIEIPFMDAVYETARTAHTCFPKCKMVFWDIMVDENDRPVVVEANLKYPITDIPQWANGRSFFGDCTPEILEYVSTVLKSNQ